MRVDVRFAKAVPAVSIDRVDLHVEFEDGNGLIALILMKQPVSQGIELASSGIELVNGASSVASDQGFNLFRNLSQQHSYFSYKRA